MTLALIDTDSALSRSNTRACHAEASTPEWLRSLFRDRDPLRPIPPDGIVFLDGDPADQLFQIVSGTIRCCTISEEGRRQIFGFARPGDFLGFSDLDTWHFTAEAVDTVTLRSVSRSTLEAVISNEPCLHKDIRRIIVDELVRREQQLMVISFLQSDERLLCFLRDQAARTRPVDGFTLLPMTRQEIGDHMGMSLETVSRSFTSLKRKRAIVMPAANRFRLSGAFGVEAITSGHIAA